MQCRFHPEREAYMTCQKMLIGYCLECFDTCESCTDPSGYCKFRTQCIIWEKYRKSEKQFRLGREAAARRE